MGNAGGTTVVDALEAPEFKEGDPVSNKGRHQVVSRGPQSITDLADSVSLFSANLLPF